MASASLYLDKRRKKKDGTYPLKISITHKGTFMVNLGIDLKEDQWENNKVVDHPQRGMLNNVIKRRLVAVNNQLIELQNNGLGRMTSKELKKIIEQESSVEDFDEEGDIKLFAEYFRRFISEKNKPGTQERYRSTLNRIGEFDDLNNLTFAEVNWSWLNRFENYLWENGVSINGAAVHFRNIRAVFNHAITHEIIPLNLYPFRKFKIKKQMTAKRSLTIKQLQLIRDTNWDEEYQFAADTFLLSFYFIGINLVDLVNLTEITPDNRIEYYRKKTGRFYSIEVLPEAHELLKKYQGKKYLLKWNEEFKDYKNFVKKINRRFDYIGEKINAPGLTSYYARHSWATIAAKLDISKEVIAASLGHGEQTVTDIYIDFDRKKIDIANKKVLKALKRKR